MSNLLTEINRMRSLMGLTSVLIVENTNPITELQAVVRKFFSMTDDEAAKYFNQLTDEEKIYLKSLSNSSDELGGVIGDLSTAAGVASLRKFMKESTNESLKKIFSKAQLLVSKNMANFNIQKILSTDLSVSSILKNAPTTIGNKKTTLFDVLSSIEKEGGVTKSKIYDGQPEMWVVLLDDLNKIPSNSPKNVKDYITSVQNDILEKLNPSDYVGVIQKQENDLVSQISNETIDDIKKVIDVEDFSSKLKKMADLDQTMRQGEDFDVDVDINNQTELKKMMGEDPDGFITKLNNFEDLTNLWLIAQHSDNDLTLQKQILDILNKQKQTIETKFPSNSKDIKSGIAMLEDRIMVNSNTSVVGYRDSGMGDFGDLINGKQTYGSQGGVTSDGNYWIPRPIEMDGKLYFFETPQKLLDDVDFLNKLNAKRSEMGLGTMEDYLSMMNKNLPGESRSLEDLGEVITNNYLYLKNQKKLGKFQQNLVDEVEKYLRGEEVDLTDNVFRTETSLNNLNKSISDYLRGYNGTEFTKTIQDILSELEDGVNVKLVVSDLDNTFPNGVTEDIKNAIESVPELKNFFKNLDNGRYKYVTENDEWLPINMLNTNSGDRRTFFRDVLQDMLNEGNYRIKNINDIQLLDEKEIEKLFKDTITYMKNNKTKMKEKISKNTKRYTKNSIVNTKRGDFGEDLIAKKFEDLGYSVLWRGGKGNALDKAGVDMIVKSPNGKVDVVSVKSISEDSYYNFFKNEISPITGNEVINFRSPGISLNNGLAAVVDSKNNIIIFPPQGKLDKTTNQINYDEPMFRSTPGPTTVEKNSLIYNGIKN
jgi:hypothetical protein